MPISSPRPLVGRSVGRSVHVASSHPTPIMLHICFTPSDSPLIAGMESTCTADAAPIGVSDAVPAAAALARRRQMRARRSRL
eukprot:3298089-Prymnesium_polylepis.1